MIRIGTRGSPLALKQTSFVVEALQQNGVETCVTTYQTSGDRCQSKPLYDMGGKALFVKELQVALLNKEIDIAVHSLKDCEATHPVGLVLGAVLPRATISDVLISERSFMPGDHFTLGTASPRRMAMIQQLYPNVQTSLLRGNVQTRLQKLLNAQFDATILAKAGLERLGLLDADGLIGYPTLRVVDLPFVPAACQGIIGIECRDNDPVLEQLAKINHLPTYQQAVIERFVIAAMEGDCRTAIGVYAEILNTTDFRLTVSYWHDTLKVLKNISSQFHLHDDWQRAILERVQEIKG